MHVAHDERIGVSRALRWYMREVHAPLLLRPLSKAAVLALFAGLFLLSCALVPRLEKCVQSSGRMGTETVYCSIFTSDSASQHAHVACWVTKRDLKAMRAIHPSIPAHPCLASNVPCVQRCCGR